MVPRCSRKIALYSSDVQAWTMLTRCRCPGGTVKDGPHEPYSVRYNTTAVLVFGHNSKIAVADMRPLCVFARGA